MKQTLYSGLHSQVYKDWDVFTLSIESQYLKNNPLQDPTLRLNPVICPKDRGQQTPVILVLSGFTGNGIKSFNFKSFEKNQIEQLMDLVLQKKAPQACYVFVDAWTRYGGSQFINSLGMGNYESYLIKELVPALKTELGVSDKASHWGVTGGSSGGYGALHLLSQYPDIFGVGAAIAPDSFFDMSLLPELYSAYPYYKAIGKGAGIREALSAGELQKKRSFHSLINAYAMGLCYQPDPSELQEVLWPFNEDGVLDREKWAAWQAFDPCVFLKTRIENLKEVEAFYLSVGDRDQFHLQYGSRQIREILQEPIVNLEYSEFKGTHFDISKDRLNVWQWFNTVW